MKKIIKASRPATLVVSLLSTSLGIAVAYRHGYIFTSVFWDIWRIFLVTIAGLLLQAGMNLVNNYFDEDVCEELNKKRTNRFLGYNRSLDEILNFKTGIVFFAITALIGLYLSFYSGIQLLIIEIIGIFSAYAYDGKPISYKKYGLGVFMSFIMMGPLMVYASYLVFSREFSIIPIVYSFSTGTFIPAILLGNELRDYEEDKRGGAGTLTVRIGYKSGLRLYYILLLLAYINTFILIIFKFLPTLSALVFLTIALLKNVREYTTNEIQLLIPLTAKVYLAFGVIFICTLII